MSEKESHDQQPLPSPSQDADYPERTADWRKLERVLLAGVRRELGAELRGRLESMDVVQDVLGEVVANAARIRSGEIRNLQAWLERVVRNRIRNLADLHRVRGREVAGDAAELPAPQPEPPDELAAADDARCLLLALADLTEVERSLIVLREYRDLPWAEVATRTGHASADAARMAYARAMVRLTGRFDQHRGGA